MKDAVGEASKRTVMLVGWIAVLILGLWVVSPSARTWYIEPDGTGDAPTIQAGVDSAALGDIVLVAAGTYEIDPYIRMKGGITVTAESGPYQTKIVPAPAANPFGAFYCQDIAGAGPTEITGFWIEGFVRIGDPSHKGCGILLMVCGEMNVTNNVITGNGVGIAGLLTSGDSVWIRNNTLIGNGSGVNVSGLYCQFNIIWDTNDGTCIVGFFNNLLNLSESCQPAANFSQDPQFCGPSAGNYYLQSDSPCAPGLSPFPDVGLIGALPVGCATVKAESKTWGAIKDLYRQ